MKKKPKSWQAELDIRLDIVSYQGEGSFKKSFFINFFIVTFVFESLTKQMNSLMR